MADTLRTLRVILNGDVSGFVKDFGKAEKSLDGLGKSVVVLNQALELVGKAFSVVEGIGAELVDLGKRGSEVANVARSFEALSAGVGQAGDEILAVTRDATKGLISDFEIMSDVNKGLLLGLPITADEMGTLGETAVTLGQAMRVGPEQALQDLITGLGRGSAAILDNLGITVKAEDAYARYAASLGKGTDALTEAEKKTAIYNAALDAAKQKVDEIGGVNLTLAERVQILNTTFTNTIDRLGELIAESPALNALLEGLAEILDSLIVSFEANEDAIKALIDNGAILLAKALVAVVDAVQLSVNVWDELKLLWASLYNVALQLALGMSKVDEAFAKVTGNADDLANARTNIQLIEAEIAANARSVNEIEAGHRAKTEAVQAFKKSLEGLVTKVEEAAGREVKAGAAARTLTKDTNDLTTANDKAAKAAAKAAEAFAKAVETQRRAITGAFDPEEVRTFAAALEKLGGAGDVATPQLEAIATKILDMKAAGLELPPVADAIVERWIRLNNANVEVDHFNETLKKLGPSAAEVSKEFNDLVAVAEKIGLDALSDQQLAAYVAEMEDLAAAGKLTTDQFLKLGAAYDEQIRRGAIPTTVEATSATVDWHQALQDISNILSSLPGVLGEVGKAVGGVTVGINGLLSGLDQFKSSKGVGGISGLLGQISGIGAAITSVIGIASSIGGVISGAFHKEEEEVNKLRDDFFSQWSDGFVGLQRELAGTIGAVENQDFVKQIFDAKTVEEFNAAVAKTRGLLDTQTEAQNELNAALEKYGFSEQVSQAQELADEGAELYKEFRLLTDGGLVPAGEALTAMGSNLSDFVNKSIAAGQAIPEAMRPMIEAAIQNGTLLDENGNAYESVEAAGISFAQTMSEQFQTLIDKLDEWLSALSGAKPSPINVPVNYTPTGEPPSGIPDIPGKPNIPGLAVGGIVKFPTLANLAERGPEAVIPLPDFQQIFDAAIGQDAGARSVENNITVNAPLNPLQTHETVRQTTDYLVAEVQRVLGANIADLVARGEA